jgi:hypothetical protein
MSAYGTKKRGGDEAVQLTFPANFQKAFDKGYKFFPSDLGSRTDLLVGTDFQSSYHEEKRMEANKVVMDGLHARRTQQQKLLTGHQNFHLPLPVLGQRKFANPAFGVVGFTSARRDGTVDAPFAVVDQSARGSGMVGGVRTAEGNTYYNLQLRRRIEQLNKMNALAQGFPVPMGQRYNNFDAEKFGTKDKVNFFLYLRVLSDSILEADYSRFSFENLKEMMDMLFKFAPTTATEDDFKEIVDGWEEMLESIRGQSEDAFALGEGEVGKEEYAETLKIFLEKGFDYIRQMSANVFRERRDKEALSRSLVKSLGFTSFLRRGNRTEQVVADEARRNPRVGQAWENIDGRHGGDGDDDGGGDGRFDRPAQGREDGEAEGMPRGPLAGRNADPNRERFGAKNGMYAFGGPAEFFGESGTGSDEQAEVAPLDLAGFDPSAQAPAQDPEILRNAVATDLEENLIALGWRAGSDILDFFTSLADGSGGEETQRQLITDTAESLERKGYSKAQIAEGMRRTGYDFFSEYVGANVGDLRPAPIEPAFRRPVSALAPSSLPFVPNVGRTQLDPSASEFKMDLGKLGLPTSRAELLAMDTEQMKAVGARIPKEFGGPYKPRADSKRASVRTALIERLKKIDPAF